MLLHRPSSGKNASQNTVHMKNILKVFILLSLVPAFGACHSKYAQFSTSFSHRMAWNNDSTAFAFVAVNRIYRRPKGLATFPDGGMSRTEYLDAALYYYDTLKKQLHRITGLNDLNRIFGRQKYEYTDLAFSGPLICFKMDKPLDFEIEDAARSVHNEEDSLKLAETIRYVYMTHIYNINSGVILDTNALPAGAEWTPARESDHQRQMQKRFLREITPADWGIEIGKVYPQSKNDYFDYIIYRQGYYDLVLEQIAPGFTEKDKKKILKKMERKKDNYYRAWKKCSVKKGDYYKSEAKKAHDDYTGYSQYMEMVKKRLFSDQQ